MALTAACGNSPLIWQACAWARCNGERRDCWHPLYAWASGTVQKPANTVARLACPTGIITITASLLTCNGSVVVVIDSHMG